MNATHRPGRSRVRDERGMGTVLIAGVCLGLVMVAATVALIVGWLARAERAQDTADLTALAAAAVEADGGDACAEASKVALVREATWSWNSPWDAVQRPRAARAASTPRACETICVPAHCASCFRSATVVPTDLSDSPASSSGP